MEEAGDGMTKYGNMMLEFIKKEIFEERKNISVEEVVTLVAALTDLSVSLLSKFRKEPIDPSRATEIGRDVRSEERRVGKECRCRWWRYHEKEKKNRQI